MSINYSSTGTPNATDTALTDPRRVAVQLLLNELRGAAFVWPLARDVSNQVFDGSLTAVIPRAEGFAVGDAPGAPSSAGTPLTNQFMNVLHSFKNDELTVDRFKAVHEYIYDLDQDRSRIDLRANFLSEAPGSLAEYLEADATAVLFRGASNATDGGTEVGTNAHYIRFSGSEGSTANALVEVSQLDDIAIQMSQLKVPKADRIFLASPKQARKLAANSAIRDASQYGTNESILNGEVARISGFRIIESPFLAPEKAVAFHRDGIYKAILQDADVESSRRHEILADLLSITVKYGLQCPRNGGLIWALGSEATHALAVSGGILADQSSVTNGVPGETNNPASSEGSDLS